MRKPLIPISLSCCLTLAVTAGPHRADDTPPTVDDDWKQDPVCRMVFFAVLEGLYTDGVPDDVVNSLIPPKKLRADEQLKTSFVIQCPLCHPVYEALSLYQQRKPFLDGESATFGDGLKPELVEQLKSLDTRTRLSALRVLVKRWVERRMGMMQLEGEAKRKLTAQLAERAGQGRSRLSKLITSDENYKDWSAYWGCAACNGVTDACATLNNPGGD